MPENISDKTAEILIDIGSVNFNIQNPFKLTSGKLSPVYCDCRRIISFPEEREKLINFAVSKIKEQKFYKQISNISGGETAGIPFSALIAAKLKLPMTYIRKQTKKFGKKEQIEGILKKSEKVVLVEDLLTDGGSKRDFINALEKKGAYVKAVFVIFNYGIFEDYFYHGENKIKLIYLTSWKSILKIAKRKKKISDSNSKIVHEFLTKMGIKNL